MNARIACAAVFAFALVCARSGGAATYYVSPAGDDSHPGSAALPWRTFQYAADRAAAGDTVLVRSGTYTGFRSVSGGEEGAPVVFSAETGASVVVNSPGPSSWHDSAIEIEGCDWWVVQGLEVTGAATAGIDVREAAHVTVRDCFCHHNGRWGIFTAYADYFTAEGNECSYQATEHGIYHSNSADFPVIRFNRCHHNQACGIQLNADPAFPGDGIISQALVEKNLVWDNGAAGGAGVNLASVRDSLIANNLVYGNRAGGIAGWDDGAGTEWGCKNNRIYHNTVHMPPEGRWALNLINGSSGNRVKNNLLIHDGSRGGLEIDSTSLPGLDSDYNVITRVSVDDIWMELGDWQAGFSQDTHSATDTAAATFRNPGSDYHLLAACFARDRAPAPGGIDDDLEGNPRPRGPAFDLGCYEYYPAPDLNGDGLVDSVDLGILCACWGIGGGAADLTGDGRVDEDDLAFLLARWNG